MKIIWYMVPETLSATDRILCQSGPFFPLLPLYGPKESKLQRQKFLSFWAIFCPFSPLTTWKIKILKLRKNTWRYHFTHLHHKWQSYDLWFLRYGAQRKEFFVNLDRFSPFYPPMDPKNQNFKKMKTHLKILSFHQCVP